jgi:hypothetical protein
MCEWNKLVYHRFILPCSLRVFINYIFHIKLLQLPHKKSIQVLQMYFITTWMSKEHDAQQSLADRSLALRGLSQLCGANNSDTKTSHPEVDI